MDEKQLFSDNKVSLVHKNNIETQHIYCESFIDKG